MQSSKPDIIVLGASAGGFQAVSQFLFQLPSNLQAAVFVVVHLSDKNSANGLLNYFEKQTLLECRLAMDREKIEYGKVYIGPPEHHLLLHNSHIILSKGARENKYRPSIDHLFRSAAAHFGSRVIGVILTGMMEDGTAGMVSIKKSGGKCIVQDPKEAVFSDMPLSVISNMEVDYILPIGEMGAVVNELLNIRVSQQFPIPLDVMKEAEIAERVSLGIDNVEVLGELFPIVCPDCGGSLYKLEDGGVTRFKCHTGHSYTDSFVLRLKSEELEESMWVALRILEEKKNLLKLMAAKAKQANEDRWEMLEDRANETKVHVERIREVLLNATECHYEPSKTSYMSDGN